MSKPTRTSSPSYPGTARDLSESRGADRGHIEREVVVKTAEVSDMREELRKLKVEGGGPV
jgi:hypothetical protein